MGSPTTQRGAKIMKAFTKDIRVEMNESQKDAVRRTAIITANHLVNAESRNIELVICKHPMPEYSDRIVVVLHEIIGENRFKRQHIELGARGKIISNDLFN
jgi:hypothetical protein